VLDIILKPVILFGMKIKYYLVDFSEIFKFEVDTDDKDYVSHNDESVIISSPGGFFKTTYSRKLETVKQELISSLKEQIANTEKLTEEDFI
jgi:hypothetical protein